MRQKYSNETGVMDGFPPSEEMIVRFDDNTYRQFPQLRWTMSNMQQLVPTKPVWRGPGAARDFLLQEAGIGEIAITTDGGQRHDIDRVLELSLTDSFAVLHNGRLLYETYLGAAGPHTLHVIQSCAKSFAGLMAEMMIDQGMLDQDATVPSYLPELAGSAWGDATLRHVLDMQVNMQFDEDYLNPESEVFNYLRAGGMIPHQPGVPVIGVTDYLPRVTAAGPHGQAFAYREPNINVLTWIMIRVGDTHLNDMLSQHIWQHIGAEHDAFYQVDPNGFCTTAGCTLRDYLRFGEALRTGLEGRISAPVRASIFGGGDRGKFAAFGHPAMPGWSYRSQFWIRHVDGRVCATARGAYGQLLYIDPVNALVIVRFAATRQSPGYLDDHLIFPLIDRITAHLTG